MDYHVFILSRVKELVDRGVPTDEAVSRGIRSTASTVTAAAAGMAAVFAIFAPLRTVHIKQRGVGLAVAVLLDATLIRGVLLPAAMKLLGDWNWYLPRWLEWRPRLTVEPDLRDTPAARDPPGARPARSSGGRALPRSRTSATHPPRGTLRTPHPCSSPDREVEG